MGVKKGEPNKNCTLIDSKPVLSQGGETKCEMSQICLLFLILLVWHSRAQMEHDKRLNYFNQFY